MGLQTQKACKFNIQNIYTYLYKELLKTTSHDTTLSATGHEQICTYPSPPLLGLLLHKPTIATAQKTKNPTLHKQLKKCTKVIVLFSSF
jgi:hypothetical protein